MPRINSPSVAGGDDEYGARIDAMYRRHHVALRRLASRIVKSSDIAGDVVHEVFRRIVEHPQRLPDSNKEEAYLRRAAYREALHHVRRTGARCEHEYDWEIEVGADEPARTDEIRWSVLTESVSDAIANLPPRYQDAFRLRYIEGYSRDDAANEMGISSKTLDEEVRRARAILRHVLARVWLEWG